MAIPTVFSEHFHFHQHSSDPRLLLERRDAYYAAAGVVLIVLFCAPYTRRPQDISDPNMITSLIFPGFFKRARMAFIASLILGCTIRSTVDSEGTHLTSTSLKLDRARFPRMHACRVHDCRSEVHRSDRDAYKKHVLNIRGKLKLTSHSSYTSMGGSCLPNNGGVVSGLLVVITGK